MSYHLSKQFQLFKHLSHMYQLYVTRRGSDNRGSAVFVAEIFLINGLLSIVFEL